MNIITQKLNIPVVTIKQINRAICLFKEFKCLVYSFNTNCIITSVSLQNKKWLITEMNPDFIKKSAIFFGKNFYISFF